MTAAPHDGIGDDAGPAFIVEGVDSDDGSRTPLYECDTSSEARHFLNGYVRSSGNAGNWDLIEVYDIRGEDHERVAYWERPDNADSDL